MIVEKIAAGIFLVRFDSQYELAASFLRIQEHYESSRFRNRVFSLEEYMDWYAATFGAFTYFEDWSGFNVPSSAFHAFYAGRFDPLLRKEARLLRRFRRVREPFYVIGIASDADLRHELAHALFFTRPSYRNEVLAAIRGCDVGVMAKRLVQMGYHPRVVEDEVHAYLVSPSGTLGKSATRLAPLRRRLRAIFERHASELSLPMHVLRHATGRRKRAAR